jgi:hypothetical protein
MDGGDGATVDGGNGTAVDGGDSTVMNGGDGAEQWQLWCSGDVSRGEAAVRSWTARWTKVAWEDNGGAWWKMNREERNKKNLTVAALYKLEHRLI